jgi:hypothetical protein
MDLIHVSDPLSILQVASDRTTSLKKGLEISRTDDRENDSFFVMSDYRLKLGKLLRSLRSLIPPIATSPSSSKPWSISSALVQQYPFLIDLVFCLESNLLVDLSVEFLLN